MSSSVQSDAWMNAALVDEIRKAHARVFGRNSAFVIDDITNLEQWARHGRKVSESATQFIADEAQKLGLE